MIGSITTLGYIGWLSCIIGHGEVGLVNEETRNYEALSYENWSLIITRKGIQDVENFRNNNLFCW